MDGCVRMHMIYVRARRGRVVVDADHQGGGGFAGGVPDEPHTASASGRLHDLLLCDISIHLRLHVTDCTYPASTAYATFSMLT